MDKKSEKAIRKTLVEEYKELKKSIEGALNSVGLEVLYIDCNLSMREGYYIYLNVKRRKVNE